MGTDVRILRTDLLHIPHKRPLQTHLPLNVCFRLAESLTAMAKQTAHGRDLKASGCYWSPIFSYKEHSMIATLRKMPDKPYYNYVQIFVFEKKISNFA